VDIVKIWEGGPVFYGGVLFAIPTALLYIRRSGLRLWPTADIWAPSLAIGHALGRVGCFCAGCCYGRPAEGLPWAVTFTSADTLAVRGGAAPSDAALRISRGIAEFPCTDTIEKASVIPGTAFLGLHTELFGDQVGHRDVQGRRGEGVSCPGFLHLAGHQRSDVLFRGFHAGDTREKASCFRVSGTCLLASRGLPPEKARCMPTRLR
jgi:Prolipoprotein diacylglyceryl transferase